LDNFENGERRPWPEYKKEILELLDTLEKTLKDKMA
jgi:hypothetical protein